MLIREAGELLLGRSQHACSSVANKNGKKGQIWVMFKNKIPGTSGRLTSEQWGRGGVQNDSQAPDSSTPGKEPAFRAGLWSRAEGRAWEDRRPVEVPEP